MTYKNLTVWQKADELAIEVYKATKLFPKDEIYGITSQIRRAALSIPTNIVGSFGFCVGEMFPPLQGEGQGGDGVKRLL